MHRQIKIVAILLMVEGALEALMGILLCVMGPVMMTLMKSAPPPSTPGAGAPPPPELFGAIYIGMGVLTLVAAIVKIVAGIRNVSFKSRVLGFVALGSCILSMASCYCILPALALGVYGLIVYIDQRSAQAFRMGAEGMQPEEILRQLDGVPQGFPQPYPPQGR